MGCVESQFVDDEGTGMILLCMRWKKGVYRRLAGLLLLLQTRKGDNDLDDEFSE